MRQTGRVFVYTGGLIRDRRVRRILHLSGLTPALGLPPKGDGQVAVWGRTGPSARGRWVAARRNAGLVTLEDAFLRSVKTGRSGEPPQGLVIDRQGIYFDCNAPSDLEGILNTADLATPELAKRAKAGIARLQQADISKYNAFDPALEVDEDGYVLVIDQTRGDASIRYGGADQVTFAAMLAAAKAENPGKSILIKTHPEVTSRYRKGHFGRADLDPHTRLVTAPISPWKLLASASKVYCVTSLMGFEAIMAGHRPRVFGRPFYGGWGLSEDEQSFERRGRKLSREMLFAGAMLIYPTWYDPYRDQLCDFETVVNNLEAQARAWREDCHGYAALEIRLWKRGHFRRFFAAAGAQLSFEDEYAKAAGSGRRGLVWAGRETPKVLKRYEEREAKLLRVEDGFLRSRGLGAELVPPMSLVVDDLGVYYDPSRESRLERLLNRADDLPETALMRAANLRARLISSGVSKYNTGAESAGVDLPEGVRILVPGQVEDDASIQLGAGDVRRNIDLLKQVRAENPDAVILFKPHPDVEAGLRKGRVPEVEARAFADVILQGMDAVAAIDLCDAVWTMTSGLGFEALLRGKDVTCLGAPFYAGWGLTRDLGPAMPRRTAKVSLEAMTHAVLIGYPRYFDPVTALACPVEVLVERIENGPDMRGGRGTRLLSKVQGVFASFAPFWRR